MLKTDLHLHVRGDPKHNLKHTARQLIDYAASLDFQVLSITNHNQLYYSQALADYAQLKNILLIPGIEKTIEGKDILIYNLSPEDLPHLKTFQDLKKLKQEKNILTIAPHPYFLLPDCLGKNLERNIQLFDAIEYSHFYHPLINRNRKAAKIAQQYNKPLVGTSDTHHLFQFNNTYTFVNSSKSIDSIFQAIRNNQCQLVTQPLSLYNFLKVAFKVSTNTL